VSGDVFAIAYRGTGDDGFLVTVTIAPDGQIGNSVIDTLEFDTGDGYEPCIIHISGNIYAVAYRGPGSDGYIKTIEISTGGLITDTVIDSQVFESGQGYEPSLLHIGGNVYAVAYRDSVNDGWVKTWEIQINGQITDTVIDSLEFDTANGYEPDIINVATDVYAIAYRGTNADGFVVTVGIKQTSGPDSYEIQSVAADCAITATVEINDASVTVISWVVQR